MKKKRESPHNLDRAQLLKWMNDQVKLEQFKPVQIFYCYAREDEKILKKLEEHFSPLKRSNEITTWSDQELHGGTDWVKEIDFHLNTADVILLLISPSFVASDFCYSEQMRKALERHQKKETVIIPVILRPTFWAITPIGMLQGLPKDNQPVTTWSNQDVAFLDIVLGIWDVIKIILRDKAKAEAKRKIEENNWTMRRWERGSPLFFSLPHADLVASIDQILLEKVHKYGYGEDFSNLYKHWTLILMSDEEKMHQAIKMMHDIYWRDSDKAIGTDT